MDAMDAAASVDCGTSSASLLNPHDTGSDESARAVEDTGAPPHVAVPHISSMEQQRLRAELTLAQYFTWFVMTKRSRTSDGAMVLVTHSSCAAEFIARNWGDHFRWTLSNMTGRTCPLTLMTPCPPIHHALVFEPRRELLA
jgi:hypothetical protein